MTHKVAAENNGLSQGLVCEQNKSIRHKAPPNYHDD
jgi:hypothetical protein